MKRFVNPFVADGSSATVIESGLIIVLVGLACMTAWMHVSASLKIPSASANTTASVETTGSVRSRWLHRASRTRRLRRSEKRLYGTRIELRLSQRECACPPCVGRCLVAEHSWNRVCWAIEAYAWRFDRCAKPARARRS
jgi:Flp pilus assembly pilin Flp